MDSPLTLHFERLRRQEEYGRLTESIGPILARFPDNFFYSPSWLIPFQKILGDDREIFHIIGRDDTGRVRGSIHLSVGTTLFLKVFRPTVLALLGTRSVVSPEHLEFPFEYETREAWCRQLEAFIHETLGAGSFVVFDSVAETAGNIAACMEYLATRGFRVIREAQDVCPCLDLPESYDRLMDGYSANMRKIIRRTLRRAGGTCRVVEYSHLGDFDTAFEEARRLHDLARTMKGDPGSFSRHGYLEFHRELARQLKEENKLYFRFLLLDDIPVAFRYGFLSGEVYYDYQTGYDPTYADRRPGFVLVALIIQDLIARKIARFDFLRGDEPYKRHWANRVRRTYRFYAFPPGVKSRIYCTLLKLYRIWRKAN